MLRSVLLASLVTVPAAAVAQPASASVQAVRALPSDFEVQELIQAYVDAGMVKGVVVGLLEPDGRRRIFTAGDAGDGSPPLSAQSMFEIGSINKTFTGTILADMVRRGEVRLDDPIAKYLPAGAKVPSRNGKQITLLDLTTHMSGLPRLPTGYRPPNPANPYADYSEENLLEFLGRYELTRDPGEKVEYSNLGVGLLGYLLVRAAGAKDLPSLIDQRILNPLKMRQTAYGRPAPIAGLFTKGHNQAGKVVPYWDVAVLSGAGGLNSNVNDMLNYVDANVGPARSPLEESMRLAQQGHRPGSRPEAKMGLGWMSFTQEGRTSLGHGGGTAGYSTFIGLDPALNAASVVLTNSGGFDYADWIGRKLLEPGWRKSVALPAAELGAYVGTYRLRDDFEIAVTLEKGRLWAQATNQARLALFAAGRDRLFLRAVDAQLGFTRDADGKVIALTLDQNGKKVTGNRVS